MTLTCHVYISVSVSCLFFYTGTSFILNLINEQSWPLPAHLQTTLIPDFFGLWKWHANQGRILNEHDLFIGAILIAQWFQPAENVTKQKVLKEIQDIADSAKIYLSETNPKHPVLIQGIDYESKWNYSKYYFYIETTNTVK